MPGWFQAESAGTDLLRPDGLSVEGAAGGKGLREACGVGGRLSNPVMEDTSLSGVHSSDYLKWTLQGDAPPPRSSSPPGSLELRGRR